MPAAELHAPEAVEITAEKEEPTTASVTVDEPSPVIQETPAAPSAAIPAPQNSVPASADPYHTDVYPNNVYSEELIYDADGNLIGKTITYPTALGSDTIWIDGRAYYDLSGFGLVEWGGPSQRTEDYTMYESGVKVGIMGGEDEAPTNGAPSNHSIEPPVPIEETIDQSVNVRPERNSAPPDYKPDTTPPDDPNARNVECPQP